MMDDDDLLLVLARWIDAAVVRLLAAGPPAGEPGTAACPAVASRAAAEQPPRETEAPPVQVPQSLNENGRT